MGSEMCIRDRQGPVKADKLELTAFPNPFNSSITIQVPAHLSHIDIYNIKGRLVERLPVYKGKALWNGSRVPSGIYIVKVPGIGAKTLLKID